MSFLSNRLPRGAPRIALLASALALVTAVPLTAQVAAGVARPTRLEVTTSSTEARASFTSALEDIYGLFVPRGVTKLKKALELDAGFGLARVLHAINAPGLTTAERNAEIDRGMSDAAKGSTGELLVASAYRENFRGNPTGARAILLSATTLLPDEPFIAHHRAMLLANMPGGTGTDALVALKAVAERFPDYAPVYNNLAYAQWTAGQRPAAMTSATTFMTKSPTQPNAHDTYAELLQWDGNFEGAVAHYKKAIELDNSFLAGSYGLSEVYVLQGKGELARAALSAALPNTTTPAQRVGIHNRIANSYVIEGNIKAAMASIGTAMEEAQKGALPGNVTGGHVALMNLEAAFGDPKTNAKAIAAHIGHIAALPLPPNPNPNPAGRLFNTGVVFAMAGQPASARIYLDSLTRHSTTVTSVTVANQVHGLTGWVLYSEGKYNEALIEFRQDNSTIPLVRTGIALTQFKLGNVAEARSIRDEVVNDRNLNLANGANVMARRMLKTKVI